MVVLLLHWDLRKSFPLYKVDKKYIFEENTIPETGALGKLCLDYRNAQRSRHPTNSFIAIGKYADEILKIMMKMQCFMIQSKNL